MIAAFRALEESLLDPAVRGSPARIEALLHPDFVEFGSSGTVYTRAEMITALLAEAPVACQATDFRVRPLGAEAVMVTYRSVRQDPAGARHALRCSIWQRDGGAWRMLFHQGTRTGQPIAPD